VAVYEGKVAVSHAGGRVDLAAGESAQTGASGVVKHGSIGEGEKAFDATSALNEPEPLSKANESLVSQISEYRRRLDAITAQKVEIEQTLKNTEQKLALKSEDGGVSSRSSFDLGTEEWKELAKDGTVKYMLPCVRKPDWTPSADYLNKVALAPHDAPALKEAYAKSNQRVWSVLKPLCAQAIGGAGPANAAVLEVAERIGNDSCVHLVLDHTRGEKGEDANEGMRLVAEARAGLRPMPSASQLDNPVAKMFLAITGEMKAFETELAQSLGPEEAHRVAFAEGMCMQRSTFGGPGPREPAKP
jgi:hypothetical protein